MPTDTSLSESGKAGLPMVSPHFGGPELFVNSHGKSIVALPADALEAATQLALQVLEPWRSQVGPLRINRWYATKELNSLQGGVSTSQHLLGEAADNTPLAVIQAADKKATLRLAYEKLVRSNLPFDQAIIYPDRLFIHVSHKRETPVFQPKQRRECLFCVDSAATGKKSYFPYEDYSEYLMSPLNYCTKMKK